MNDGSSIDEVPSHVAMEGSKWVWMLANLRCDQCAARYEASAGSLQCSNCDQKQNFSGRAINFLDQDTVEQFHIDATDNVSDHPFDGNAMAIIKRVGETGGMVLDCGSGYKSSSFPHVVQLEITPYRHVDILAVNQRLPFVDNCFDAVFSLDVLEHVDQPFVAASEIARVMKPGGVLYIDLPFLQPEHGYPHHYFNASRSGLVQLFEGHLNVVDHLVPASGHPIFWLHWALSIYASGLPEETERAFRSMTIDDLLAHEPTAWLDNPITSGLSEAAQWIIASTTQAILRKPVREHPEPVSEIDLTSLPGFAHRQSNQDLNGADSTVPTRSLLTRAIGKAKRTIKRTS